MKKSLYKSIDYLNECFTCEDEAGELYWKFRPKKHFSTDGAWKSFNGEFAGKRAGCHVVEHGYMQVTFGGKTYSAHRVIFAMVNGRWPEKRIFHRDGDKTNNCIDNLVDGRAKAEPKKENERELEVVRHGIYVGRPLDV